MKKFRLFVAVTVLLSMLAGCGMGNDKEDMQGGAGVMEGSWQENQGPAADDGFLLQDYAAPQEEASAEGATAGGAAEIFGAPEKEMNSEEQPDWNTEEYNSLEESGFKSVKNNPVSTFSADVDTASYTNLRRMIEDNCSIEDIPAGSVRIEEMLNYFKYDYKLPVGNEPFGVTTVIGDCPWNKDARLLQIGLKTEEIDFSEAPSSNLVFLLDVSGSMDSADKLPLLQSAFTMLVDELTEKDRVSIVTYAGSDAVLLEGEPGSSKREITDVINNLYASGSTNGSAGIETAYRLAEENFIEGGNNRVILATDGDLNVGATSESELKELIEEKRESGIFLSVLGFGTGNIKDNKMEALADNGNGNYSYIDSRGEAKRVMVEEMGASLVTVAKDVKLQIEFNPAYIKGYRLIGYENRTLATEDFDDDTKDAGEIGAGHIVTALYEIVTAESGQEIPETDLKYQEGTEGVENGEWATLKIRYKEPDADESILKEYTITEDAYTAEPNEDFYFAAAVAELGLLVRDSRYKGQSSFENVEGLLDKVNTRADDYKDEFAYLVKKLRRNSPREKQGRNTVGKTDVACEWGDLKIALAIPEDWAYEIEEYSDENRRFGVRFAPEGCNSRVCLYFWESFGVCGTELAQQDITFDSGLSGSMGIYDGADSWSFIVFPEQASSGTFAAVLEGESDWLAEYNDEVLEILGTAVMEDRRLCKLPVAFNNSSIAN